MTGRPAAFSGNTKRFPGKVQERPTSDSGKNFATNFAPPGKKNYAKHITTTGRIKADTKEQLNVFNCMANQAGIRP
jgi:hypothetical protein